MKIYLTILCSVGLILSAFSQTDILDARTNYSDDDEVTVTGIVTNGAELGSVRYIQDGTAGIALYPGDDWGSFDEPAPGDEVTVTGVLSTFNGLLEVGPDLSDVTINSSGNMIPDPMLMDVTEMDEDDEGELIVFEGCLFDAAGGTFSGNSTHSFISNGNSGVIYLRDANPLVGEDIPWGELTITGIASQFSFDGSGGYQLLPRGAEDMVNTSSINIASTVNVDNFTTTSFDIQWLTDADGDTKIEYGLTDALGSEMEVDEMVSDHTMSLSGLEPATIYFVRVSSTNGVDTAYSAIRPHITRSLSSGTIRAYFTGSVDNSVATIEDAVSLGAATNDTIAAYIANAQSTVDIAVYNINDQTIVNAINEAYDNGVQIRYIAQGTNANLGLEQLEDGIPVLEREDELGSGMHNKFVIIDAENADECWLLTGSTNFTTSGLVDDYNNVILFQEQSLCMGFRAEFEEMWGSDSNEANEANSKFGPDKSYDTPSQYYCGEVPVEAYFSPSDFVNQQIISTIETTDEELDFALLVLTRDDITDALIDVNDSFFAFARGIIEQTNGEGSDFDELDGAGIEVYSHVGISGQLHHKYCLVDPNDVSADPIVLTGSHNWSSSANNFNDENTVVVHDARVANLYYQEFIARWLEFVDDSIEENTEASTSVFPNPTTSILQITWDGSLSRVPYRISDLTGRVIDLGWINGMGTQNSLDVESLATGTYLFQVIDGSSSAVQFVKQ